VALDFTFSPVKYRIENGTAGKQVAAQLGYTGKAFHVSGYGLFCFALETWPHYIAQAGFKLATLLPQLPECCDYQSGSVLELGIYQKRLKEFEELILHQKKQ
jgi:hypothetical protein